MITEQKYLSEFFEIVSDYAIDFDDDALRNVGRYFFFLHSKNQFLNLTGYKTIREFAVFHLMDSLQLVNQIPNKSHLSVIDIGTGAGIPGLIVALLRPQCQVTLVESIAKKIEFLAEVVHRLHLSNVFIENVRAEQLAHQKSYRENFDIAIARALAGLSACLELTAPFVKQTGVIHLLRGSDESTGEVCMETLGLSQSAKQEYSLPGRNERFQLLSFKKTASTPEKFPRKPGQIKKRPL